MEEGSGLPYIAKWRTSGLLLRMSSEITRLSLVTVVMRCCEVDCDFVRGGWIMKYGRFGGHFSIFYHVNNGFRSDCRNDNQHS